jgi:hypothetical protein
MEMTQESFSRLHKTLERLIRLQDEPEVRNSSWLQHVIYSVEHDIAVTLDAARGAE